MAKTKLQDSQEYKAFLTTLEKHWKNVVLVTGPTNANEGRLLKTLGKGDPTLPKKHLDLLVGDAEDKLKHPLRTLKGLELTILPPGDAEIDVVPPVVEGWAAVR